MNKKIKSLSLVASLLTLSSPMLTMACGTTSEVTNKKDITRNDVFLVTDTLSVEDKGFNEQGYNALKTISGYTDFVKLKDEKVLAQESHEAEDIVDNGYRIADGKNAKLIMAPGFYHIDAIKRYNTTTKNRSNFMLADGVIDDSNVASIIFEVKYSAFQAGYLACKYLDARLDTDPKIAMWGGSEIPSVTDFLTGFIYGIYHYNNTRQEGKPKVEIVRTNLDPNIEDVIRTNTGFDNHSSGTNLHGKKTAEKAIELGADILFPVAGAQTYDAISAIKDPTNKRVVRIVGVDTNQAESYALNKGLFITSVEKNVQKAFEEVYKVITKDADADNDNFNGLGEITTGTLDNELVGISDNTDEGYGWTLDTTNLSAIANAAAIYGEVANWTIAQIDEMVRDEESNHLSLKDKTWESAKTLANNWANTR